MKVGVIDCWATAGLARAATSSRAALRNCVLRWIVLPRRRESPRHLPTLPMTCSHGMVGCHACARRRRFTWLADQVRPCAGGAAVATPAGHRVEPDAAVIGALKAPRSDAQLVNQPSDALLRGALAH